MTELEKLKNENEMLQIKNNALNELVKNTYSESQYLMLKEQLNETEIILSDKTIELNKLRKELHAKMGDFINLRENVATYSKNSLIYFMKTLKENATTEDEKALCKKIQTTINYLIFKLKHLIDKF